jgi:hypothetical protein
MLRKTIIVLATAAALTGGLTADAFARGGFGGGGRAGFVRNPTTLLGSPAPQMPAFENRAPAPLSAPAQAPTINGPMSQPAFRGLTGIGQ